MAQRSFDGKIRCSFCGKTQDQVRKLISGPNGVYICDECVALCNDILTEEFETDSDEAIEEMDIRLRKGLYLTSQFKTYSRHTRYKLYPNVHSTTFEGDLMLTWAL